jgi:hypothetical protein
MEMRYEFQGLVLVTYLVAISIFDYLNCRINIRHLQLIFHLHSRMLFDCVSGPLERCDENYNVILYFGTLYNMNTR